jgi:FkbM family methyltransferase
MSRRRFADLLEGHTSLSPLARRVLKRFGADRLLTFVSRIIYPIEEQWTIEGVDLDFVVENRADRHHLHTLSSERDIIADMMSRINTDDVVFDVGANFGGYACFAAASCQRGQVYAFEPHPENVRRIQMNAATNDLPVDIREVALSDHSGTAELAVHEEDKMHHLEAEGSRTIPIQLHAADELIANGGVEPPNVVKIDVEGAEYDVLQGMKETLQNPKCRLVYCEIHPESSLEWGVSDAEKQSIFELFEKSGFDIERIDDGSFIHIRAEK